MENSETESLLINGRLAELKIDDKLLNSPRFFEILKLLDSRSTDQKRSILLSFGAGNIEFVDVS